MTRQELLDFHKAFCARGLEIMAKKNNDYAGSSGTTPFANFESTELLGITTVEKGFLVRIVDKIKRLITFSNDGKLAVTNESADDACLDILNYCVLLAAYIMDKRVNKLKQAVEEKKV